MADVQKAISFVINLEDDHTHPGCITQLAGDKGGKTRLGIAQRFHPELTASGFFDGDPIAGSTNPLRWTPTTVSTAEGAEVAAGVYTKDYAAPLTLEKIEDQDVADRVFALAVNAGQHQAVVCVQRALGLGVVVDGVFGPGTLSALNAIAPAEFVARLKLEESAFYTHVATNNPELASYAKGLQHRAQA